MHPLIFLNQWVHSHDVIKHILTRLKWHKFWKDGIKWRKIALTLFKAKIGYPFYWSAPFFHVLVKCDKESLFLCSTFIACCNLWFFISCDIFAVTVVILGLHHRGFGLTFRLRWKNTHRICNSTVIDTSSLGSKVCLEPEGYYFLNDAIKSTDDRSEHFHLLAAFWSFRIL